MHIVDVFFKSGYQADQEETEELKLLTQWKRKKGGFRASMFIFGKHKEGKKNSSFVLCFC